MINRMVKITHRNACTYRIYFSTEARKIYPYSRVKFNTRELTLKEPSEFEKSIKIGKYGNSAIGSLDDISGEYNIESEDGVYYLIKTN